MTPEQMRIAIAEACGWTFTSSTWFSPGGGSYARRVEFGDGIEIPDCDILPNYPENLNAMHEAEKVLKTGCDIGEHTESWTYNRTLERIAGKGGAIRATAPQRAEAFLRTLGKWVEDAK